MAAHAREHGAPALRATEQLCDLHRGDHESEARRERERPGVARGRSNLEPPFPSTEPERREQRRLRVERRDLVASGREIERHTAGAGAEVEYAPAGRGGELTPQR